MLSRLLRRRLVGGVGCRWHAVRCTGCSAGVEAQRQMSTAVPRIQAAALIIGDEILTGKVEDKNIPFLASFCFERGITFTRAEIIRDDIPTIAERVLALSELVGPSGYVFTTGGIGPTHDDMTYEAIASAFGVGLELHEPTRGALDKLMKKRGQELTPARLRMAMLPEGCAVHTKPKLWVPLANIGNVYILPGIPWLFENMLNAHASLFQEGQRIFRKQLITATSEGDLAEPLGQLQQRFPGVAMGSYPQTNPDNLHNFRTKLTFEGVNEAEVEETAAHMLSLVGGEEFSQ